MLVMLSLSTYSLTTCTGITLCRPPICIQYTHTDTFDGHFSGTTQVSHKASTTKVKPVWILLKQETLSGSSISWGICKSASRSRQITTPAPDHLVFYSPDAFPAVQPTV